MIFDAVILAGGRASRLGGLSKPTALGLDGESLLDRAISAASNAERIIVVGDAPAREGIQVIREDPPYSGPVSALAAAREALDGSPASFTLVLAADLPHLAAAVDSVLRAVDALADGTTDGVLATDEDGRDQYLLACYSSEALSARLRDAPATGGSMRTLVQDLRLLRIAVPAGSTADVDTWDDAARLGVGRLDGLDGGHTVGGALDSAGLTGLGREARRR